MKFFAACFAMLTLASLGSAQSQTEIAQKAYTIAVQSGAHEIVANLVETKHTSPQGEGPRFEVEYYKASAVSSQYISDTKRVMVATLPTVNYPMRRKEALSAVTALAAENPSLKKISVRQTGWAKCSERWINNSCGPEPVFQVQLEFINRPPTTTSIPDASYRVL